MSWLCKLWHKWEYDHDAGAWAYYKCERCGERMAERNCLRVLGPKEEWWLAGKDEPPEFEPPPTHREGGFAGTVYLEDALRVKKDDATEPPEYEAPPCPKNSDLNWRCADCGRDLGGRFTITSPWGEHYCEICGKAREIGR